MFNFENVSADDYQLLPNGEYPVIIEKAEWKVSQNSGSEYLNVMFSVIGESHNGRKIFNIYNLLHAKEQVKNIALSDLKKLLVAAGVDEMNFNSKESLIEALLGLRVNLKVGQRVDSYGEKNIVKGYSPVVIGDKSLDVPF